MLLDRAHLVMLTNNAAFNDATSFPDDYLTGVFNAVRAEMTTALRWSPVLEVIQNEEGLVRYVTDGVYAGRYYAELKRKPLISGPATGIFQNLQLTYALAYSGPTNVGLELVQVTHPTGEIFALGPGMVEALAGVTFSFAAPKPAVYATGYIASYVAGYATGISDPVPNGGGTGFAAHAVLSEGGIVSVVVDSPGSGYVTPPMLVVTDPTGSGALLTAVLPPTGGVGSVVVQAPGKGLTSPTISVSSAPSFNAPVLPDDIQQAAVLLSRERIAFDLALNSGSPLNTASGAVTALKTGNQSLNFLPASPKLPPTNLGYGGFLAQTAASKIARFEKKRMPDFL